MTAGKVTPDWTLLQWSSPGEVFFNVLECLEILTSLFLLLPLRVTFTFLRHITVGPRRKSWSLATSLTHAILKTVISHFHPLGRVSLLLTKSVLHWITVPVPWCSVDVVKLAVEKDHDEALRVLKIRDQDYSNTPIQHSRVLEAEIVRFRSLWPPGIRRSSTVTSPSGSIPNKYTLYVHGGAYYFLSPRSHRSITSMFSRCTNSTVVALDYRLAPDHLFPSALLDILSTYLYMIRMDGLHTSLSSSSSRHRNRNQYIPKLEPKDIIVAGDSSGAGLVLAFLLLLKELNLESPSCAVLLSPHVDAQFSGASWVLNRETCFMTPDLEGCRGAMYHYSHSYGPSNPYLSPVHAVHGVKPKLCPILIQAGSAEVLVDDARLLYKNLQLTDTPVVYEEHEDQFHVWHAFTYLKSARDAFESIGKWVSSLP